MKRKRPYKSTGEQKRKSQKTLQEGKISKEKADELIKNWTVKLKRLKSFRVYLLKRKGRE